MAVNIGVPIFASENIESNGEDWVLVETITEENAVDPNAICLSHNWSNWILTDESFDYLYDDVYCKSWTQNYVRTCSNCSKNESKKTVSKSKHQIVSVDGYRQCKICKIGWLNLD